jgi:hypothetical protein
MIFYESQLLSEDLTNSLNEMIAHLSDFNQNSKIQEYFSSNISHYKISQKKMNNKLILNYTKENITFSDFNLLIASRFSILTRDIKDFGQPIYILNKTEGEIFKNVFKTERLSTYQENIYMLILDYMEYSDKLDKIVYGIIDTILTKKNSIRKIIYCVLFFNLAIFIIVIFFLLLYLFMYFTLILNNLNKIGNNMKEKIGDITIKELIINKLDNLKLILKIYETDINKTINNLKKMYNNYLDNYKIKMKEESKLLKRDGKYESKKDKKTTNNINVIKIFQTIKKNQIFEYSGRKVLYVCTLYFLIFIRFFISFLMVFLWTLFYKKDGRVHDWNVISEETNIATYQLMNNYLMMIYDNQTYDELSKRYNSSDFMAFIYKKITPLYELDRYASSISNVLKITDLAMIYDCLDFYENLDNEIFKKLKKKFDKDEEKLMYTMWFFCEWSNTMTFQNFKTIYLQLFTQVKTSMEFYQNHEYSDIIEFIDEYNVVKNEIMYLIIYTYIMDIMYQNIIAATLNMNYIMDLDITICFVYIFIVLLILIISINLVYFRNVNNDCKKFIHISKIFKVCNTHV